MTMRSRKMRGNALLVAMIALAVLMVLVVGALRFTGTNREGAAAKNKGDVTSACADTARRQLLSQMRTFGVPVGNLVLDSTLPDNPVPAERTRILTAHYGSTTPQSTIVPVSGKSMGQPRDGINNRSNMLGTVAMSGQYYRTVVKCREAGTNRESEIEFSFRHGP